ncbi:RNA polymerase subunit sigma-70 [Rhizobium leguminosarum bv. viciae USDA 2370]|nr:RNA polymerase subunit sigma-70 [Rhizobium leguminosarum bv. viciae USDA 2370]
MKNSRPTLGRPRHNRTPVNCRVVRVLAEHGIPQFQIARVLDIDEKTLRLHYRRELDVGAARLEAALALRLYAIAGGKGAIALRAAIFILKARFGWSPYLPPPR